MLKTLFSILNSKKITSDIDGIKPGSIYIDMYSSNERDLNYAYDKGAELIITSKEVLNTSLPIIKVENASRTYLKLLNTIYNNPLDKAGFITIFGGNRSNTIASILDFIFKNKYYRKMHKKGLYNTLASLAPMINNLNIEDFFYYVLSRILQNIDKIPLPSDSSYQLIEPVISKNIECIIIEDCMYLNMSDISNEESNKPIIINNDKPYALTIINGRSDSLIITYGLNKKAAVTATSIDYGEKTAFNYCLQRTFYSKTGKKIEPFEVPLTIKGLGINRIYAALAAISCALYYDIDMKTIKESLLDYNGLNRDFLIKEYENFTLIDNYCTSYLDFKEVFEVLQYVDYKKIYLLLSNAIINDEKSELIITDFIREVAISVNIKEIFIITFVKNESEKKNYKRFESLKNELNIHISYFNELVNAITYFINDVKEKDVLLVLGGRELIRPEIIIELLLKNK
ncbi:MAG: hypothetical protein M0P77_07160 [Firmicutes bacterium]|nr:hypothetical protein [Bacillota bacterium]